MKWIAPVALSFAMTVSGLAVPAAGAADLPQPTKDILKELKLDESILNGLDAELQVPAGWVEKAKQEKDLIIVSSWDQNQFAKMTRAFKLRYPFINLRYARASYNARVVKTLIAYKEGRHITDILTGFGGGVSLFKDIDALADLSDIPNFRKLKKDNRDPDSRWLGQRLRYWCMAYNTKLVKEADLPKRWEDLITNKRWHNRKIGIANRPQLWLLMLWAAKGPEWTTDYMKRLVEEVKPQLRKEGTNALISLAIAGEFDAAIPAAAYRTSQYVAKGAPIGWHCPEPIPLAISEMGILKGAPHIHAAKIFSNWFLSKEGQIAQFASNNAPPVHPELQTNRFLVFPDAVLGKEIAFRAPDLEKRLSKEMYTAWNPLWSKATGESGPKKLVKFNITLKDIKRGGRRIYFSHKGKDRRMSISGRRTKVYINGKMDDRANLKPGMTCAITAPEKAREAKTVSCK
ncbi:MAG: extracellular solute-binding protein [Alphaproteobacteria bacterium]|nr:extracellular solute-binding protein [Alphaproteobacteria bacterium]